LSDKHVFRLDELAELLGAQLVGDGETQITGLSSLSDSSAGDLTFYADPRYEDAVARTKAAAVLTRSELASFDGPQLILDDPFLAFLALVDRFHPPAEHIAGISENADVAAGATIGDGTTVYPFATVGARARIGAATVIHPGVHVGADVVIGDRCTLWPNVVVREDCRIGDDVIVHAGAVIGADGFGFARRGGAFIKVRHVGSVHIENDVEIGANATIDRGTLGRTLIGRGVKIDNLVHIAHNVQIGEASALAAQVGISGSSVIGQRVLIGGQAGIADHVVVHDDAILLAQSGVIGEIEERTAVSGYPARPHRETMRAQAEIRRLSSLKRRVRELEARLDVLRQESSSSSSPQKSPQESKDE